MESHAQVPVGRLCTGITIKFRLSRSEATFYGARGVYVKIVTGSIRWNQGRIEPPKAVSSHVPSTSTSPAWIACSIRAGKVGLDVWLGATRNLRLECGAGNFLLLHYNILNYHI